jgi:hypothetical protein
VDEDTQEDDLEEEDDEDAEEDEDEEDLDQEETAPPSAEPQQQETVTVKMIGQRPADVTHWRCRRMTPEKRGSGPLLTWGDPSTGLEYDEWPIRELSVQAISDRWGPGTYVVEWYRIGADGSRKPRGRSRTLRMMGKTDKPARAGEPAGAAAAPPFPQPTMMAPVSNGGLDMNAMFSVLAFMDERAEKARAAERAAMEMQLERERLASQERIAQMQAMQRSSGRSSSHVDHDALSRVTEAINEMRREMEDRLSYEQPAPAQQIVQAAQQQQSEALAIVKEIRESLVPLLGPIATALATKVTTAT